MDWQNVWFHTCSFVMDVVIDASMARMLPQDPPTDAATVTDFDVYIHKLLMHAHGYNTL